jgi:hypothetical protein
MGEVRSTEGVMPWYSPSDDEGGTMVLVVIRLVYRVIGLILGVSTPPLARPNWTLPFRNRKSLVPALQMQFDPPHPMIGRASQALFYEPGPPS